MHGMVFAELQEYVSGKHGPGVWDQLLQNAKLGGKLYLPVNEYPDSEIKAIVSAAVSMTGRPVAEILEEFGEFIAPSLLKLYGHLLAPNWTALDVIEHTEGTVHTVVRIKNPGARPPQLKAKRTAPNEVALVYTSPQQMCFLAIGIGRGLGRHYHENLTIVQTCCVYRGDDFCEIVYRKMG